jgi:fructosamine-3-kinase
VQSADPGPADDDYQIFDLRTESGQIFSLKVDLVSPAERFFREAQSLEALIIPAGPRLPKPIRAGDNFLLLEHLEAAPRRGSFWSQLGQQLARLHNQTAEAFGFSFSSYLGKVPQPNDWTPDGAAFFGGQRLLWQARKASERGLLGREDIRRVERLAGRLRHLVPQERPSLLHGNLWIKKVTSDPEGNPALIDPAPYYGWAEADLASTALFGVFPEDFFRCYEELHPLEPDYRQRFPIYNLYPLLVRLNLYGEGFLSPVLAVLDRFV